MVDRESCCLLLLRLPGAACCLRTRRGRFVGVDPDRRLPRQPGWQPGRQSHRQLDIWALFLDCLGLRAGKTARWRAAETRPSPAA